jgi:DNA-binding CsgD family transcriptional regulator
MLSESRLQSSHARHVGVLDFMATEPMCVTVTTQKADDSGRLQASSTPGALSPAVAAVARLTEGQRDCLRLVHQLMTSKDIARTLDLSPHTVDMRVRTALKTLRVTSRAEAARLVAAFDEAHARPYQPLVYQPSEIVTAVGLGDERASASVEAVMPGGAPAVAAESFATRPSPVADPVSGIALAASANASTLASTAKDWPDAPASDPGIGVRPFPGSRPYGAVNDLSIGARLGWVLIIAFGSAMGFGAILAALAALKNLL